MKGWYKVCGLDFHWRISLLLFPRDADPAKVL